LHDRAREAHGGAAGNRDTAETHDRAGGGAAAPPGEAPAGVRRQWIYRGRIVQLALDEFTAPAGKRVQREVVVHPGAAAILAFSADGGILLERQYRYATGKELWEIPAGIINPGEDPATAARRELAEETGWHAGELEPCCAFYSSPGFTDERLYLFRTTVTARGQTHFDEDENIVSGFMPAERIRDMLAAGEIQDAKTLVALLWAQVHGFLP